MWSTFGFWPIIWKTNGIFISLKMLSATKIQKTCYYVNIVVFDDVTGLKGLKEWQTSSEMLYVNQTSIWFTSIICHFVVWRSRKHKYIWDLFYQLPCPYRTRQKQSYNSRVHFTTCPLFRTIIYNQQGLCSFQELKEYFSLPSTKSSMTLKTHGVPWTHSYFFHSLSELF